MQPSYVIGIDIGTGSTKAVALGQGGDVLCSTQQFYPSAGKTEQDLPPVFSAFVQTIKEVVGKIGQPPFAISLSSAMHSIMAVDERGEPLTKAILWSDTRSTGIARELRQSPEGEAIYCATGTPLHSMSPLCKIKWLQQYEPAVFAGAAKFISLKEAIWHQLFGEYVVDHSLASATGLLNVHLRKWEPSALNFAGIAPQQLSALVPVTYQKKGLPPGIANAMGLPQDTLFFVGGSDGTLANLGSLCLTPDEAAITIGTSAAVRITSPKPVQNPERMLFSYLLDEHHFVCGGATNNGGNVFQWLLKTLFAGHEEVRNYDQLFAAIASVPAGSNGLLALPYLHGERAPIWDEESRGAFFGLSEKHSLFHLARAAAEGVCFSLNHILSSLEEVCGAVRRINISGGLVQSPVMMQMLADVTGKQLVVQQTEDASAIGAALLARKALGLIPDFAAVSKKEGQVFQPQSGATALYHKLFAVYKNLYPLLKDSLHTLHQFSR